MNAIAYAFLVAGIPALVMLLSAAVLFIPVSRVFMASMQNFAAGIVLAAVGGELLPLMEQYQSVAQHFTVALGWVIGGAVMFGLDHLEHSQSGGHEEDAEGEAEAAGADREKGDTHPLREMDGLEDGALPQLRHTSSASRLEQALLDKPTAQQQQQRALVPWGQVGAVAVNSGIDGLLIGVTFGAHHRAGIILAVATSIEMLFLGITHIAAVKRAGRMPITVGVLLLHPTVLVLFGLIGAAATDFMRDYPSVFAGTISFGTICLIFLVTQELILEAHEHGGSAWWIHIWLFIGFQVAVQSEHLLPEE